MGCNDGEETLVVVGKLLPLLLVVDGEDASQFGFHHHRHGEQRPYCFIPLNPPKTLIGTWIVDDERLLVQVHPTEERLIEMVMLVIARAHHRANKRPHCLVFLLFHQRDDALLCVHCAQRPSHNGLDDLLGVEGCSNCAGQIVENGKFFNGASKTLVLLLQRAESNFLAST